MNNISFLFCKHPKNVCMTYWQHFTFSMKIAAIFLQGYVKAFIHAIFPDIYITSTTELVHFIQEELKSVGCR
jgi:hypothetical protein